MRSFIFKMIKKCLIFVNYSMKLKHKLLVSYFALIIIPLSVFTLLSYQNISKTFIKDAKFSANQVLSQTSDMLNYKINNIIYVSDQIFFEDNLNQTLIKDENLPVGPELMSDYASVNNFIQKSFKSNDMDNLTLYLNNSIYYSHAEISHSTDIRTVFSNTDTISQEDWYRELKNFSGKVMWLSPSYNKQSAIYDKSVISVVRFIKDTNDYQNYVGVLRIDLLEENMQAIIRKAAMYNEGVAYLINSRGQIISSSNSKLADKYRVGSDISSNAGNTTKWSTVTMNGENVLSGFVKIQDTDWVLVSVIPYNKILSAGRQTQSEMLMLMFIIGTLAYLLAYFISDTITKRIRLLTKKIKRIQANDYSSIMDVCGNDEVSELIKNYNYMLDRIKYYSDLQFKLGKEIKNAELKALQAQINPHFLYNTLELINWTALTEHVPVISQIVQALAKFYKLSLSKGEEMVTIANEIEHVKTYVQLQNFRFDNAIKLEINVEDELYNHMMPKLSMQPIVENSILHGIMEKKDKTGTIKITGKLSETAITLCIEDDGVGMNEAQVASLFKVKPDKEHGYGLGNVNQRIQIKYGSDYGVNCSSVAGRGTRIEIAIAP